MAWQYEIANGDPLNKFWLCFCEIANALHARIVLLNGSDSAAPSYIVDSGVSKTPTIGSLSPLALRHSDLVANVGTFRNAIFTGGTGAKKWVDPTTKTTYISSISQLLSYGSYGSSWLDANKFWHPDCMAQMQEAMENLRYLYYPCTYSHYELAGQVTSSAKGIDPEDDKPTAAEAQARYEELWAASAGPVDSTNFIVYGQRASSSTATGPEYSIGTYTPIVGSLDRQSALLTNTFNNFNAGVVGSIIESFMCMKTRFIHLSGWPEYVGGAFSMNATNDHTTISVPISDPNTTYHLVDLEGATITYGALTWSETLPAVTIPYAWTSPFYSAIVGFYAECPLPLSAPTPGLSGDDEVNYYILDLASELDYI